MTKIKLLAFTKIEFLVVIAIIVIFAALLMPAMPRRVTLLTKETEADLKNIRQLLFDMDFDKAVQAAEAIRQKAGREVAYHEIVYRLAEAERFDEVQKYVSKIGSAFRRTYHPSPSRIIQSRLAETLAAAGRFDEAEQILKKGEHQRQTIATVSLFFLSANRLDDAIRLLNEYPQDDYSFKIRRVIAARLAKNGNHQKAINIARSIPLYSGRNGAYLEIIREQLKNDQYQDAIQTFSLIEILRYKQRAAAIFVVYLLEKGRADEAMQIANRFQSAAQVTIQNSETNNDNDPFATTPDEWNKHASNKHIRPFPSTYWLSTIEDIFASFKQLEQPDTKTTSLTESDNAISDEKLKVLLADIESMPDVHEDHFEYVLCSENELFHKVIKQLVKLNRTEEALPFVERLRKRCRLLQAQRFYQQYSALGTSQSDEITLNYNLYFPSGWNENLYYLWDAQISVGQLDEALLTIRKLHVTDPKGCSEARRVIAEALFEAGRIDEAKEQASLALKFAERAGKYNLDLVGMLFKIGQVAEAQLVLSKIETPSVLDDDPNHWFKSPVDVKIERQKIDHWREILEKKE